MPSSKPSVSYNLFAGFWLIRMVVAESWGWWEQVLKITVKSVASADSFMNDSSVACNTNSILPNIELLLKLESVISNSASTLSTKYIIFLILYCHLSNIHSIFTRSRFHLKKSFFLLIRKKCPLICQFIIRLYQPSHIFRFHF